jgi:iron complex transport system substrate-binding protein
MTRRVVLFAAVAGALTLTPPGRALAGHGSQTGSSGTVQVPSRVISLIPAVTEMLFAIGAGARIVGVSSFDQYPPEVGQLARVGGLIDPDVERILSLRPDLVVIYETQTDLRQQLERAGIAMYVYAHAGLADISATMRSLGVRIGLAAEADRSARGMEEAVQRIRDRTRGLPRPTTLLVFGRQPGTLMGIDASGGEGFLHDMLETAGGINVFGDIRRQSVQASTEMVLARRPEVIIELRYGRTSATADQLERDRASWSVLASVPAVRNDRVIVLTGDEFVVPGPRVPSAIERLARALHPEAFPRNRNPAP